MSTLRWTDRALRVSRAASERRTVKEAKVLVVGVRAVGQREEGQIACEHFVLREVGRARPFDPWPECVVKVDEHDAEDDGRVNRLRACAAREQMIQKLALVARRQRRQA